MTDYYTFTKFDNALAEAAFENTMVSDFEAQFGECGYGSDWNSLTVVDTLTDYDDHELSERLQSGFGLKRYLVWLRETNEGFVRVIDYAELDSAQATAIRSVFNQAAEEDSEFSNDLDF